MLTVSILRVLLIILYRGNRYTFPNNMTRERYCVQDVASDNVRDFERT